MRLRVAGPDDAEAVTRVLRSSYPAAMATAYPAELLERVLPRMASANPALLRSGRYYLAEAGGEPVGCGGWSLEEPGSGRVQPALAHVRHFGTAAPWMGRGVARLIYRRCEADARAAGVRAFLCFSSLNGEPFYAALGFRAVRRMDVAMGPGLRFPTVLMQKAIG